MCVTTFVAGAAFSAVGDGVLNVFADKLFYIAAAAPVNGYAMIRQEAQGAFAHISGKHHANAHMRQLRRDVGFAAAASRRSTIAGPGRS